MSHTLYGLTKVAVKTFTTFATEIHDYYKENLKSGLSSANAHRVSAVKPTFSEI